jgi:hypothetical protein
MSPSDNEVIFHAARDIPDPDRRREYVREACGGDQTRIALVEALLAAADAPDSLLDRPAVGPVADATRTEPSVPEEDLPLEFLTPSEKPGSLGRLGHYEVLEVIGRGGMGVVLRAFDEELHRVVAIKVMAQQLATSATARKRFKREAQAVAAVIHDHIVTIHAVEEANGLPYLVMQYVAGLSLQQRLDRDGPLELQEVLRIGMQTASGLAAAHAQGLIHRDIKPANILLENGVERVKITDFGLARAAADASLTQSGMVAGTPQYMSPEQAEGKAVDPRTDLFSLGSVLYAMCTGRAPFRASGTLAVLKRVCEETPTPIRETNPGVPDWLVEIIDKLHAKDPAQRHQSAAEVAELLGRHLAQVQHPSLVAPPAAEEPAPAPPAAAPAGVSRRRRWAVAAGVLAAVAAGLGTTEATGVTRLRATVTRLFTPEGTLVVETDDPAVKLTVESDGDLVITGAGPQEVRLKAGSYKLRATKDGKPVKLDRDLVTIARGDTQVVRVRLEDAPPAAVAPTTEPGAFVVLGGNGVEVRRHDTLAGAVLAASDGDTIEVRGNGPFVSRPIKVGKTPLTIRAGQGFRPVIRLDVGHVREGDTLLETNSTLCLEGLELHATGRPPEGVEPWWPNLVHGLYGDARLFVAHCRFVAREVTGAPIRAAEVAVLDVRNCQFATTGALLYSPARESRVVLRSNVMVPGLFGWVCNMFHPDVQDVAVDLEHNTLVSLNALQFNLDFMPNAVDEKARQAVKTLRIRASGNLCDGSHAALRFEQSEAFVQQHKELSVPEMETLLRAMVAWREGRNGFRAGTRLLDLAARGVSLPPSRPSKTVADWEAFWGLADTGSVQGRIRYAGGNVFERARTAPESLTPEDFRLRPDSAGYRAGEDGKDLGADVDRVGPGIAYERWKATPEYLAWLKDSGQVKK